MTATAFLIGPWQARRHRQLPCHPVVPNQSGSVHTSSPSLHAPPPQNQLPLANCVLLRGCSQVVTVGCSVFFLASSNQPTHPQPMLEMSHDIKSLRQSTMFVHSRIGSRSHTPTRIIDHELTHAHVNTEASRPAQQFITGRSHAVTASSLLIPGFFL